MGSIDDDMQNAQSCSWWFGFLADACCIMNILLTCVALFVCMLFLRNVFFYDVNLVQMHWVTIKLLPGMATNDNKQWDEN